ncbi:hypothetical protein NUACC26_012880 [Scytonema sp. NUACC26]
MSRILPRQSGTQTLTKVCFETYFARCIHNAILEATATETLRNKVMLAMSYDAALRREELCALTTSDIAPAFRLITIRAENTKNRLERIVPDSEATGVLYSNYLRYRRQLSRERGGLFLSESRRNKGKPISIST